MPSKAFALFALLSAEPNHTLLRGHIRGVLWGDVDQKNGDSNLRQLIARVRKLEREMGAQLLAIGPRAITLNTDRFEVDLASALRFDVSRLAIEHDWERLEHFVTSYSGTVLSGVSILATAFEEWLTDMQDRLNRQIILALRSLIGASNVLTSASARQVFAEMLLELDPAQELGYRALMEIHHANGERALALQAYHRCRNVLRAELGIEPDARTRRLAVELGFPDLPRPSHPAPMRTEQVAVEASPGGGHAPGSVSEQPSVVILSPSVLAEDRFASKLAEALVDDVASGLFRYRSFTIVSPHTSARLSADYPMPGDRGVMEKIDYAVRISIRPAASGLSAVFLLTRIKTGVVVRTVEVDFDADKLPLLFDRVSHNVINALADAVEQSELRAPFAANDATAYRLYLEGRAEMGSSNLPNLRRARNWYRKSLDLSGSYAPAFAGLSRTLSMERLVRGMTEDSLLRQALAMADRAIEADPFDARGMRERGFSSLYLRRHDESLYCFEQAAELNPNDADLLADFADALTHSGNPDLARKMCLKAMALNPIPPDYYHWILGSIHYQTEDYETAIEALEPVRKHPGTARLLAASCAMAGHTQEARYYAAIVKRNYPEFRTDRLSWIVPDKLARDTSHLEEGLRLAGL